MRIETLNIGYTDNSGRYNQLELRAQPSYTKTLEDQFLSWLIQNGFYDHIEVKKAFSVPGAVLDRMI